MGTVRSIRYQFSPGVRVRASNEILVPLCKTPRMTPSCSRRASLPSGSSESTYLRLSMTVVLPAPRPPTSTLRFFAEVNRQAVKKATLPRESDKLGVFLRNRIGRKTDPRAGIEYCLAQTVEGDVRHLDPAPRGGLRQILGRAYIARIEYGDRILSPVIPLTVDDRSIRFVRSSTAPGIAIAWRSLDRQTRTRDWPDSFRSKPPCADVT